MSEWQPLHEVRPRDRKFAVALVALVLLGLGVPWLVRQASPRIAVQFAWEESSRTTIAITDGGQCWAGLDPWGRPWYPRRLPPPDRVFAAAMGETPVRPAPYSAGPNGVDEGGAGDDVYPQVHRGVIRQRAPLTGVLSLALHEQGRVWILTLAGCLLVLYAQARAFLCPPSETVWVELFAAAVMAGPWVGIGAFVATRRPGVFEPLGSHLLAPLPVAVGGTVWVVTTLACVGWRARRARAAATASDTPG